MGFKRKAVIVMIVYCSAMSVLWMLWGEPVGVPLKYHRKYKMANYFVNTEGCVIPLYNAFDKTVMKFFSKAKHLNCNVKVPWTTQNNMTLNLVKNGSDISYCDYREIVRTAKDDWKFTYSKTVNFNRSLDINSEFIRVNCYDGKHKMQYANFHAFVPRSPDKVASLDEKLTKHKDSNKPKETLNVVFIGLDSLSRLNHIRLMPRTREFLLQNLSAIDLQGYTKVADNTYVNVVPLTTGNFVEEENKRISISDVRGPFDNYNLIWKNYSNNGYSTLLAEDAPNIGTFNYIKKGFADKPVDHYIRPLTLAADKGRDAWHRGGDCVWGRSESKLILDYNLDFLRTYKDRPHFGYTFLSHLTHDVITYAAYADDDYYDHLVTLHSEGLLDNTVLFFFSDHGIRFGSILKTDIGQIELRMPTFYIVLPSWFKERYPEIYQNVRNNENSLTSPFDIYETLKDILYFTGKPRQNVDVSQRGLSLFDSIPETRTCEDAGILAQWCVCKMKEIPLKENGVLYHDGVDFLLNLINNKTQKYPACVTRTLKTVKYVKLFTNKQMRVVPPIVNTTDNVTSLSSMAIFKTLIILSPDDAEFEAALKHNEENNSFKLAGAISRNNKYGHTADCVQNSNVRKFCYCAHSTTTSTPSTTSITTIATTTSMPFTPTSTPITPATSKKSSPSTSQTPSPNTSNMLTTSQIPSPKTSNLLTTSQISSPKTSNLLTTSHISSPKTSNLLTTSQISSPKT